MAFTRDYEINGFSGNHWQVGNVIVNPFEPSIKSTVYLFKDINQAAQHSFFNSKIMLACPISITGTNAQEFIQEISPDPITGLISKDAVTALYERLAAMTEKPWFGGLPAQDVYHWAGA